MAAFERSGDFMKGFSQDDDSQSTGDSSEGLIGVKFSMENGVFKRDAFIRDPEKHKQQMDSISSAESFLEGMKYTLRYRFPRRIKDASSPDVKLSLDGRSIELERPFLEYFKNPDVLDLEVVLEDIVHPSSVASGGSVLWGGDTVNGLLLGELWNGGSLESVGDGVG